MRVAGRRVAVLLWCAALVAIWPGVRATGQPGKDADADEVERINARIEKSVGWYDIFPAEGAAAPLKPKTVMKWRNVTRGPEGGAIMVIWPHNGRPLATAGIFQWKGKICHEFDSLSRGNKLIARDKDRVIWSPAAAGVEFKRVPSAAEPAKTAAARLLQMKDIASQFRATFTGWGRDETYQEELRLLPTPVYRYELTQPDEPGGDLVDGALFAYVQGTDPEVILLLEAVGTAKKAEWQYAFARATSGGLVVRRGDEVVWTAVKNPPSQTPTLPHLTMQRLVEK
jgi:hypothetical protein